MIETGAINAGVAGLAGKNATSQSKLSENFDNFLKLLTTQMQHQDPLQPMDSSEFTNQLVQYAGVEQQIASNQKLDDLIKVTSASVTQAALGYIGMDVHIRDDHFAYDGQPIDLTYSFDRPAKTAKLAVLNASNQVIRTFTGETSGGDHTLAWNGLDENGRQVPAGDYHLAIGVESPDGEPVKTAITVPGRVDGIATENEGIFLIVGENTYPMDRIVSILEPTTD
ncbi:MAG: flagellar hook capping FlgD N-terminal domain-containing protein [Pseudomonadota bacterium]|nr:flagellar hook capping FlgD N-terminal domain-containing protein [Pseudomonadota bacterium]